MAEMGADFRFEVQDYKSAAPDPKPYVPVEDMNNYDRSRTRATTSTPVFHRATPIRTKNARDITFTLSGFLNATDPGQQILRDAEAEDVDVTVRVLPDGVNGFTQLVTVGTITHRTGAEGLQEHSFQCSATADPVVIGMGPII